jgi:hypothetical protein
MARYQGEPYLAPRKWQALGGDAGVVPARLPSIKQLKGIRMKRAALALCAGLALVVGVSTATAGGNSDAAHACQQGGWQNLVRADGKAFLNMGDCVSYAAQGGVLSTKPAPVVSTPGSENFSEDAFGSTPTTFSGGTIDQADYAPAPAWDPSFPAGGILVTGPYFNAFTTGDGTHFLFTGIGQNTAKLTFDNPVTNLQVEAMSDKTSIPTTLTLTGYDASNHVVATASGPDAGYNSVTLKISSSSANIKYFTITTDDPNLAGLGFSNIVWS